MEKIRILNKLLLVTYNLGGLCLILIGHMRGIGAPTGYIPAWLKLITILVFSTMILAHIFRFILEKKVQRQSDMN